MVLYYCLHLVAFTHEAHLVDLEVSDIMNFSLDHPCPWAALVPTCSASAVEAHIVVVIDYIINFDKVADINQGLSCPHIDSVPRPDTQDSISTNSDAFDTIVADFNPNSINHAGLTSIANLDFAGSIDLHPLVLVDN